MLWKCCIQYASKFGKLSSGHRTGKGQFSFQSQRYGMPKNAQGTTQLHSSYMLVKKCSKFSRPGFNSMWTMNLQMFNLDLEKVRGTWDQIANIQWIIKKPREFQKNIYFFCFVDYAKAFDCVDHNKLGNSERDGNTRPPALPLETGQEATVRTGHGTKDWFQTGKEVPQDYILSLCLFNLYAEYFMRNAGLNKWRRTKEPLDESERGELKSCLKTQHSGN